MDSASGKLNNTLALLKGKSLSPSDACSAVFPGKHFFHQFSCGGLVLRTDVNVVHITVNFSSRTEITVIQ